MHHFIPSGHVIPRGGRDNLESNFCYILGANKILPPTYKNQMAIP